MPSEYALSASSSLTIGMHCRIDKNTEGTFIPGLPGIPESPWGPRGPVSPYEGKTEQYKRWFA